MRKMRLHMEGSCSTVSDMSPVNTGVGRAHRFATATVGVVVSAHLLALIALSADFFSHIGGREVASVDLVEGLLIACVVLWLAAFVVVVLYGIKGAQGWRGRGKRRTVVLLIARWVLVPVVSLGLIALGVVAGELGFLP